ncbi:MAG: PspC domain-containing protein [Cyclobacteriaceae bacterium]|nr:PspC domain-containing protein [Cyclobacteriaceae bacterium]
MKKNISINISGIIFHIEEDGFDRLKEYLDSINKYFSTFEDSSEIIADIESRIAEIFLEKLKEDKQVITNDDVSALIATMGSIQDFQAIEEDGGVFEEKEEKAKEEKTEKPKTERKKKRLYRDTKRKLVGGVASGIAHYFSIDPVWIRLLFIVLIFDAFITLSVGPISVIVYIVLWIAVPGSDHLEEDKSLKKLYRNPDEKVIGGVANGLATYLDIDVTVFRVLFVLSIFLGGSGLLIYIVLWIILPEAKTITDKVQMEGEKVTLENIDSSIKKAKAKDENPEEESTLSRILLFPFRIIADIFRGLAHAITPILKFFVEVVRIFAGVVLVIIGISLFFSITVVAIALLGLITGTTFIHMDFIPVQLLSETMPWVGTVGVYLVTSIPALLLLLVGVSFLSKRSVMSPTFGWALFGMWLIGIAMTAASLPKVIFQYRENATVTETRMLPANYKSMYFDVNYSGMEEYDGLRVKLKGYDGDEIKLVEEFSAQGPTKREAAENAKMVTYGVVQKDSVITFDSNVEFTDDAVFRDQELSLTIYMPYNVKFQMDGDFGRLLRYGLSSYGFYQSDIKNNIFYFNETGLDCATCADSEKVADSRRGNYEEVYDESTSVHGNFKAYQFENFDAVKVVGPFDISIAQGDEYRVIVSGDEDKIDEISVEEDNNKLVVAYDDEDIDLYRGYRKLKLKIITPHLTSLDIKGAAVGNVAGFEEDKMYIKLAASTELKVDADVRSLEVRLSSASELNLVGKGDVMETRLSSAAVLNSYKYEAQNVSVNASSGAKAKVYATETLSIKASTLSDVRYRGSATVTRQNTSTLGTVEED